MRSLIVWATKAPHGCCARFCRWEQPLPRVWALPGDACRVLGYCQHEGCSIASVCTGCGSSPLGCGSRPLLSARVPGPGPDLCLLCISILWPVFCLCARFSPFARPLPLCAFQFFGQSFAPACISVPGPDLCLCLHLCPFASSLPLCTF